MKTKILSILALLLTVTQGAWATDPTGSVTVYQGVYHAIRVEGTATDADVPGQSITVHVYVRQGSTDIKVVGLQTNASDGHFAGYVTDLAPGTYDVQVYALNNVSGHNPSIGIQSGVTVLDNRSTQPTGNIEAATGENGSIHLQGWAFDPDSPDWSDMRIYVYVDDKSIEPAPLANVLRTDVNTARGVTGSHGFSAYIPVAPGSHKVDIYFQNDSGSGNPHVFSQNITVSSPYAVTYNANGGTGAPSAQEKRTGIDLTLSSTQPTRDGYTFAGWNTQADGNGTPYAAGATYSANAAVTLYATWTPTYTATFADGNDNTDWTIDPASGVEGTTVTVSYSGENKVKSVTVKKIPSPVTLSTSSISFTADDFSQDITVTRDGDGAITATSSNEGIVRCTVSGNVVTVHRAHGTNATATITISVAASEAYTAPADVTCSYEQAIMRTPKDAIAADKGRFLGLWGYLWPKEATAYISNEPLCAVVAYVGSCPNYFDKCLCVALEDISDSKLPNATAHTTLATWASSHSVNGHDGTRYETDNGGVYDYVNGGESTYKTRTSGVVKGWRLPTVCDWAYLMLGYGVIDAIPSGGIVHGTTAWGSWASLRTAIDNATGGTSLKTDADYGCGTCLPDNTNSTWHINRGSNVWYSSNENSDASWIYYYRAVFAY